MPQKISFYIYSAKKNNHAGSHHTKQKSSRTVFIYKISSMSQPLPCDCYFILLNTGGGKRVDVEHSYTAYLIVLS